MTKTRNTTYCIVTLTGRGLDSHVDAGGYDTLLAAEDMAEMNHDGEWAIVDSSGGYHGPLYLCDSDTTEELSPAQLGVDATEYCRAIVRSLDAGDEGHVRVNGRRVYAE